MKVDRDGRNRSRSLALLRIANLPFDVLAPLAARRPAGIVEELLGLERQASAEAGAIESGLFAAAGDRTEDHDRRAGPLGHGVGSLIRKVEVRCLRLELRRARVHGQATRSRAPGPHLMFVDVQNAANDRVG